MSKGTRTREINARQAKVAAMQAAEAKRKQRLVVSLTAIGVVLVIIVVLVVTALVTGGSGGGPASTSAADPVIKGVTSVSGSTFDKVGVGSAQAAPRAIKGAPLTEGGKPKVLYVGAEYCPYCAAERWAVVAAMSRFGTFNNLGQTHSSSVDVYPSTPTLSFHGATYDSKYLAFNGYELQSNQRQGSGYAPLDHPPAADQKIFQTYDAAPYVPAQSQGSIPFIDLGGKYMISGASYNPGDLQGMTHQQVADALSDPSSKVAQSVDGTANLITASLCKLTNNQPGNVCSSSGVKAAAAKLPAS